MQVVILCGGKGIRLKEKTEFIPKPLVNIGDYPILFHLMRWFAKFNQKEFILNLGYRGFQIKEFFLNFDFINHDFRIHKNQIQFLNKKNVIDDWNIIFASTGENANKAQRITRIEKLITDDNFLLTYGDGLADIDISELIDFHKKHNKLITISGVDIQGRFGELLIEKNMLKKFEEKPTSPGKYINGGFFVIKKEIFKYLRKLKSNQDFETHLLPSLAKINQVMVFKHDGFWSCMDNHRDYLHLNSLVKKKNYPWK